MKRVILFSLVLGLVSAVFAQEGGTPNSVWMYVGSTYWDLQTQGSVGRMIATSENGTHFSWTQSNPSHSQRQVYYNCLDAATNSLSTEAGEQVDNGDRSGFPVIAVLPFNFSVMAYNARTNEGWTNIKAVVEFLPCRGAFMLNDVDWPWPVTTTVFAKLDTDESGRIHVAGTVDANGDVAYYRRGYPYDEDGLGWWVEWETDEIILSSGSYVYGSVDIARSSTSDRVAAAWIEDPLPDSDAENIYLSVSEDGGFNWSTPIGVTNIPPIDPQCVENGGNWVECNADTFRPWRDLSIVFDPNDYIHVAFSARGWHYFNEQGEAGPFQYLKGTIWHWGENSHNFTLVANGFFDLGDTVTLGMNDLTCHKPSLSVATETTWMGPTLLCAFQQFDPHAYSSRGYAIGEYYLSYSHDWGATWTPPRNISNTPGVPNDPEGQNPSERDITLTKFTTDDTVRALYLHDYSAGSSVFPYDEGPVTACPVVYMRTPVDDIHTTQVQENLPFRADSTGFPSASDQIAPLQSAFELHPNYPNPFNPSTTLQFDLVKAGDVKLTVFDVLGKEVVTLVDSRMSAGVHSVEFDGEKFASGVYFARLSVEDVAMTRKMVLMK